MAECNDEQCVQHGDALYCESCSQWVADECATCGRDRPRAGARNSLGHGRTVSKAWGGDRDRRLGGRTGQ